jgi:tetratricopeptide (TPR) repeat protein
VEDHKRLDELRRRVDQDPASIAFAPFAEELRKAGEYDAAVRVCQAGLDHHPTYLSARVTLGRSLVQLERYPEARTELEYVLQAAPDNLLAQKGMNELLEREGDASRELEAPVAHAVVDAPPPLMSEPPPAGAPPVDPALGELEGWQARIHADRAQRTGRPS